MQPVTIVLLVTCGILGVNSQCLSENDRREVDANIDLFSTTDFGLTLFKKLFPQNSNDNFFFSPYSIWNALILAYFGSGGRTEIQLQKALGVTDKFTTYRRWRGLEFFYRLRQSNTSAYAFNLANRAYFDKYIPLRHCIKDVLHSEVQTIDFGNPGASADEINSWVSNVTKGSISQLVTPMDLANAHMVLANAAYFKGKWLYQFKSAATEKDLFYASPTEYYWVNMMTQKASFRHGISEELGAHILELPYTGEKIVMYILLPPFIAGENGFNQMVERLNSETLRNAIDDVWRTQVEVTIPKFRLEETIRSELIDALHSMGVVDLFDPVLANLTTFSTAGGLSIGKSIHKAFVDVSEEGTEAAAATALISFRVARPAGPQKFVCNHPFLFLIYDTSTKNVLFMGAYKHPLKAQKI